MIARNFIRFPDALRFQRELFHNGYKNQPRIMRAMECIFKFVPDVPQWVKDSKRLAKQLVKHWKAAQIDLNFKAAFDWFKKTKELEKRGFTGYLGTEFGQTWTGRGKEPKWVAHARIHGRLWEM